MTTHFTNRLVKSLRTPYTTCRI